MSSGGAAAYQVPTSEPTQCIAGDTWQWTAQFADYPTSEAGTLTYGFTGPATFALTSVCTIVGDSYSVTVPAATTAAYAAGTYQWAAYITLAGVRHTARVGTMYVAPNLATITGVNQSHAAKMLALIEAELEARVTGASAGGEASIESYQIAGRSVSKIPTKELETMRGRYRWAVYCEQHPGSLGPSVGVRFTGAGS